MIHITFNNKVKDESLDTNRKTCPLKSERREKKAPSMSLQCSLSAPSTHPVYYR